MNRFKLNRIILLAMFIVFILNFACEPAPPRNPNSKVEISANDIFYHIKYLASDELKGRKAGTEGAEQAAKYIANEFKRYVSKPIGDDGSYYQKFEFIAGVEIGSQNKFMVKINGKELEYKVEKDFIPISFSSNEEVSSEIVFAGYGIFSPKLNYDDYENIDVKDKTVIVLRYGPEGDNPHSDFHEYSSLRYKTLTARERGAKSIMLVTGPESYEEDELVKLRYDNSVSDSGIPAISIGRKIADEIIKASGKDLREAQKEIDTSKKSNSFLVNNVTVSFKADIIKQRKITSNVVGLLEGKDETLKDEIIIIGAHYDHLGLGGSGSLASKAEGAIHNGADDNASGIAGLLELAQLFSSKKDELKRSILFIAFSAEETGVLGSAHYVKNPILPLEKTVAMLNMDMIGRQKDNKLTIHGIGTSSIWKELVEELNSETNFNLKLNDDGYGPSDLASFYGKDLPVLFFFTGAHEDYHKPSDDYDKINTEGEQKIVEYVYAIAQEVNSKEERPQFTKIKGSSQQRSTRGFRVYLGTIPDYAEEVEGVKLTGVREGSPAEKAGMLGGDVIIKFGDTNIKNIYDYVYALGKYKPGDEVDIIVVREEQEVSLRVKLEKRK